MSTKGSMRRTAVHQAAHSTAATAQSACRALEDLAAQLLREGSYLPAFKCLEALSLSASQLPADAARLRLQLARLVLQQTTDAAVARFHLERAQLALQSTKGNFGLRCEVTDQMGECLTRLGLLKLQKQSLTKAVQLCREQPVNNRSQAGRWGLHFSLQLAALHARLGDLDGSAMAANDACSWAASQPLADQVLTALTAAQLQLATRQFQTAGQLLQGCTGKLATACAAVEKEQRQQQQQQQSAHLSCLQAHANILQVLLCLATGDTAHLSAQPLQDLEGILQSLSKSTEPWAYTWLCRPGVTALVHLLMASILQPRAKQKEAAEHLTAGRRCIDSHLASLGFDSKAGEQAVPASLQSEVQQLLQLAFLLDEGFVIQTLISSHYVTAATSLASMIAQQNLYPGMLSTLLPSLHLLIGQYAAALGATEAAQKHFAACSGSCSMAGGSTIKHMAVLSLAILYLDMDTSDSLASATELLKQHDLFSAISTSLPHHERSSALLVSGAVLMRLGDEAGGRQRLPKALKLAHTGMQNYQLVTQVLNHFAPAQLATGDAPGAINMLTSSLTLGQSLHDLPTQIIACNESVMLHTKIGSVEKAQASTASCQRRQQELQQRQQHATQSADHQQILSWHIAQ